MNYVGFILNSFLLLKKTYRTESKIVIMLITHEWLAVYISLYLACEISECYDLFLIVIIR